VSFVEKKIRKEKKDETMKFAFSSNAFLRCSLIETIRIISALGYQGIEIMADVPHAYPKHLSATDLRDIKKALDDNGLAISNINGFMHHADGDTYHPSWIESDPGLRAKRVEYTLRCLDLAEQLGAATLSTEPGGPLEDMPRDEGLRLFKEGLVAVEKHAREKGVRILIEPEPGLLIESSGQFASLFSELAPDVSELAPDVFGLNCDIGHFFCVGEDPVRIIKDMKGVIHHFHLEDIASSREHYHLMLGDGAINLPQVLQAIEEIGYDDFVTVELYTYSEKPQDAARSAIAYLQNWREASQRVTSPANVKALSP
jgi:sugar phosphate isomerase/epimerase